MPQPQRNAISHENSSRDQSVEACRRCTSIAKLRPPDARKIRVGRLGVAPDVGELLNNKVIRPAQSNVPVANITEPNGWVLGVATNDLGPIQRFKTPYILVLSRSSRITP